jgi:hypothetical protein
VLRRIFGSKMDKTTVCKKKIRNKLLRNFYSYQNITKMIKIREKIGGEYNTHGKLRNSYIFALKPAGKRPSERHESKWKGNIKTDLKIQHWKV